MGVGNNLCDKIIPIHAIIPHLFRQKAEERKISRGLKDYSNFIYNLDVVANLSPQITYLQTDFSSKVSV